MNAPSPSASIDPSLPSGVVRLADGARLTVALDGGGDVIARRAASCLLRPEPGDRVLVTLSPEPFVLAVLERDEEAGSVIELAGDVVVRAAGGRLSLEGREGIALRTREAVGMVARALDVHVGRTSITSEIMSATAKKVRGTFEEAGVVAEAIDRVAERITEKAARVYRTVTEMDNLRARHFDHRADSSARISGQNAVVTARETVKVDAEQVLIG